MTTPRNSSDFDPGALTQKTDEHTKILGSLQKRVGTNENFGKTFRESADVSKDIDTAIKEVIVKLLNDNTDAQDAVKSIVGKIDGREMKKQLLGIGKIAAWVISLAITALITAWITVTVTNSNQASKANTSNTVNR